MVVDIYFVGGTRPSHLLVKGAIYLSLGAPAAASFGYKNSGGRSRIRRAV